MSERFSDALLGAVDFALGSIGESCKQAMYFHLKMTFHIERTEIPEKIGEFDEALRSIFRDGAVFLEKLILTTLCEDLKVRFDPKECSDFPETISKIRKIASEREPASTVPDFAEVTMTRERIGGERVER